MERSPRLSRLSPGMHAPPLVLPRAGGSPWRLEEALARGPVLLAFHRGTW